MMREKTEIIIYEEFNMYVCSLYTRKHEDNGCWGRGARRRQREMRWQTSGLLEYLWETFDISHRNKIVCACLLELSQIYIHTIHIQNSIAKRVNLLGWVLFCFRLLLDLVAFQANSNLSLKYLTYTAAHIVTHTHTHTRTQTPEFP